MERVETVARHVVGGAPPQPKRPPITSHVLDQVSGRPAQNVSVTLDILDPATGNWRKLGSDITNSDGRCGKMLPVGSVLEAATYRCTFDTKSYFAAQGGRCFYPEVPIIFTVIDPSEHYHIPLLLSPFGYSTYRGS